MKIACGNGKVNRAGCARASGLKMKWNGKNWWDVEMSYKDRARHRLFCVALHLVCRHWRRDDSRTYNNVGSAESLK